MVGDAGGISRHVGWPPRPVRDGADIQRACLVCGGTRLVDWLDLGDQPLANQLSEAPPVDVPRYPLLVSRCHDCAHSQLRVTVNPAVLFDGSYPYRPGLLPGFRRHCDRLAAEILTEVPGEARRVLDVGGCDGTALNAFWRHGVQPQDMALVDPAAAPPARFVEAGLRVHPTFFAGAAARLRTDWGIIVTQNVLAHVTDPGALLAQLSQHLHVDGVLVIEVPYGGHLLSEGQFDTVYHEHVSYWLVGPLARLLKEHTSLSIRRITRHPLHGGTIRVVAGRPRALDMNTDVETWRWWERQAGFYGCDVAGALVAPADLYTRVASHVHDLPRAFRAFLATGELNKNKAAERPARAGWAGFGAAAKATVAASYLGITPDLLMYIADDTPEKQGKWTPFGVPIVPAERLREDPPGTVLVFPWNWLPDITRRLRDVGLSADVRLVTVVPRVQCRTLGELP